LSQLWEDKFRRWSKPPSLSEVAKQNNAERMVSEAMRESAALRSHKTSVIVQGSYRNRTNVPQDSDVDICVCCKDTFFYNFGSADYGQSEAGVIDATYSYTQFKNDVQAALETKFGTRGVRRGDKAFDLRENTYRVDSDVVAAFAYKWYRKRTFNALIGEFVPSYVTPEGTKFHSDSGLEVINWPEQQYSNGVAKNDRTGTRFKSIVRTLKNLRYDMAESGISESNCICSYLIESLIYNVPDFVLSGESYYQNVRDCIAMCYQATAPEGDCDKWFEPNGIKFLFHSSQPWTRQQVNEFTLAAWRYCGFA
jgi:hypothetical protein